MLVKCKKCKCEFDLEDDIFIALFERKETIFCFKCLPFEIDEICEGCKHDIILSKGKHISYCELHPDYISIYCKEKVIKK